MALISSSSSSYFPNNSEVGNDFCSPNKSIWLANTSWPHVTTSMKFTNLCCLVWWVFLELSVQVYIIRVGRTIKYVLHPVSKVSNVATRLVGGGQSSYDYKKKIKDNILLWVGAILLLSLIVGLIWIDGLRWAYDSMYMFP